MKYNIGKWSEINDSANNVSNVNRDDVGTYE